MKSLNFVGDGLGPLVVLTKGERVMLAMTDTPQRRDAPSRRQGCWPGGRSSSGQVSSAKWQVYLVVVM